MRIGIYVEAAREKQVTGIGRHVLCLLDALARADRENEYLLYYPAAPFGRRENFLGELKAPNFRSRPVWFPRRWIWEYPRLWWEYYLPLILRRDKIDVFHGPNHFVPKFDRARTVVTIHDLAFFRMPVHGEAQDRCYQEWVRKAMNWAQAVIALSQNTKADVAQLSVADERIRIIYGGGNIVPDERIQFHREAELRQQLKLDGKFVLFVGALQPRKNVPYLIRAFAKLKQRLPSGHRLVLAGPKWDATQEIEALARDLGIADDVILTGYLEDWQIPLLYKLADLFVLPTRYEGFTLVTLEAMAYGTPVIATDSSSIREGVGDAAVLVPVDADELLADAMQRVLTDEDHRRDLISRGRVQAGRFTWEQCARETLKLYEDLYRASRKGSSRT